MTDIRYADDTVLMANSEKNLQDIVNKVDEASEIYGMALNPTKTEVMVISKKKDVPHCNIKIKSDNIKQVENFKYLGSTITSDGRCDIDIKTRIAIAKEFFQRMSKILCNKKLSVNIRCRVLECYIWPILQYGCESWTISEIYKKKLEAAEMWFYRKMQRISYTAHKTNEEVLRQCNRHRKLIQSIRKRQLDFLGHIIRKRGLEHLALTGRIEGKRSQGRQRKTYMDNIKDIAGTTTQQILHMAVDRARWKSISKGWVNQGT